MVNMRKYTFGIATKKLIALSLCCLTAVPSLTSCGVDATYNFTGLAVDSRDRFSTSIQLARDMYNSGLISEDSLEAVEERSLALNSFINEQISGMNAAPDPSGVQTEKTKVHYGWASIPKADIFYKNNFSNSAEYKEDTFNILQGIIAFKPVNHSKKSSDTLDRALNLDDDVVLSYPDYEDDPTQQPIIHNDCNDLYGNDNWEGQYRYPSSLDDLEGAEILNCLPNMLCIHRGLFNVYEGYGNSHLDRWFVKGAYVNANRELIALDTKYNDFTYFKEWEGNDEDTESIINDVANGKNKTNQTLSAYRQQLVDDLNLNKANSKQNCNGVEWVSEDDYFKGLTKDPSLGYTLSTYGNNTDGTAHSHKVYSIPGVHTTTTKIPIDSKYPYTALNTTDPDKIDGDLGTIEPENGGWKSNWEDYKDSDRDYCQDVCFPINIVPASVVDEFEKALDLPVYTLKPDALSNYKEVYSVIGNPSKAEGMLNSYFTKASGGVIDSNGNITSIGGSSTLTLRDIFMAEAEKLANGNDEYLNYLLNTNNMILTTTWNDNPVELVSYTDVDDTTLEVRGTQTAWRVKNEVGKDLVLCQQIGTGNSESASVTPVMAIRVNEFNLTYCSLLNSMLGLFNDTSTANVSAVSDSDYGKYKLIHDANGNALGIVVLEYPVDAIADFRGTSDGKIRAVFKDSGLGINIGSGKIIKYNYEGSSYGSCKFSKEGNYISDIDSIYYRTDGGNKSLALGTTIKILGKRVTPLGLSGSTVTYKNGSYNLSSGNRSTTISKEYGVYAPRFYLTVYLEALYAPGMTSDSNVALFGRRFVLKDPTGNDNPSEVVLEKKTITSGGTTIDVSTKTLEYDVTDKLATYIDNEGKTLKYNGEDLVLGITDICDFYELAKPSDSAKVECFGDKAETLPALDSDSEEHTITELTQNIVAPSSSGSRVVATRMFPSDDIGKVDGDAEKNYCSSAKSDVEKVLLNLSVMNSSSSVSSALVDTMGETSKQEFINQAVYGNTNQISLTSSDIKHRNRFWAMAVKKSLFTDEIYDGWMKSDTWSAGLSWWNTYLESNSFAYRITASTFNSYVRKSYKNQVIARGEIEDYDVGTIEDIESYYNQEAKHERVQNIRTVFKIVGYIIIAFAFILILLWAIDTNTDLGLNLLQKVTFGNWIAIKYASDIPDNRNMDKKYITGGKIVIRSMILIAVGLVIIVINAFDIVRILVDTFGTIGKTIEDLIKGK